MICKISLTPAAYFSMFAAPYWAFSIQGMIVVMDRILFFTRLCQAQAIPTFRGGFFY
jgi:hypothetical protein